MQTSKQQRQGGIANSEEQKLLKSIDEKIERIKIAADAGIQVPRRLFPAKYWLKYGVNNIWKMNLFNYWRLIYTIKGEKIEVLCIVLDLIDHPTYNKIFGYKKK